MAIALQVIPAAFAFAFALFGTLIPQATPHPDRHGGATPLVGSIRLVGSTGPVVVRHGEQTQPGHKKQDPPPGHPDPDVQPTPPKPQTDRTTDQTAKPDQTGQTERTGSDLPVEEAIRLANDIFDRLEADRNSEPSPALLQQAERYIKIVREKDPTNPRLHYLSGLRFAYEDRAGDAIEQLRKFVQTPQGRNEWRAYRKLGDLFVSEFPQLAKGAYEKAAALNPTEPSVLFGRSRCADMLGDRSSAIRLARQAVSADGGKTIAYRSHLARLYYLDQQWDEALKEAQGALKLAKQVIKEHPGQRRPLLVANEQLRLLVSILQGRLRQPDQDLADLYLQLAHYTRDRGRIAEQLLRHEVLHVLETGVNKTAPYTPTALLEEYGAALARVDRIDKAVSVFEKILQTDPANQTAAHWLRRLRDESATPPPTEKP